MAEPYCLAMVLCDSVHRDPGTGKSFILGTFSNFSSRTFPAKLRFCTYFSVTDALGPVTLRLQLVSASTDPVDALNEDDDPGRVFLMKVGQNFQSPLVVMEGMFGVETILPVPGLYHCELWANSEILMSRRLTATLIPDMESESEPDSNPDNE